MRCELDALEKAHQLVSLLEDKKAEKILLLDIQQVTPLTDYFIICTGTSDRMLQALATTVREFCKQEYRQPLTIEGDSRAGWMIADLGEVVIHFFSPDQRSYYRLEQLWDKGKRLLSLQ